MSEYRYFINTRGRKIRANVSEANQLLQRGFVEITEDQFKNIEYSPALDKGSINPVQAITPSKNNPSVQTKQVKRQEFNTTLV